MMIHIITMETPHYSFMAVADTRLLAEKAMRHGWRIWRKSNGVDAALMTPTNELQDTYGFSYFQAPAYPGVHGRRAIPTVFMDGKILWSFKA